MVTMALSGKSPISTWKHRIMFKTRQYNTLMYLIYYSILVGVSSLMFISGFLLLRYEFREQSQCNVLPFPSSDVSQNIFNPVNIHEETRDGCWMRPTFKKAVIILVDSLRYDFIEQTEEQLDEDNSNYLNHMPNINRLYREHPQNTLRYSFYADPPTVTMQRIKGIATGSLPTFIDIGSNFAADRVFEDNIVSQLYGDKSNNNIDDEKEKENYRRKVVFVGDETWIQLFGDQFYKQYPYPSLNVLDFDTVDNGVIDRLIPTIRNQDGPWDVAIGHMLGVDHVAHTYGNRVPDFSAKLEQVDSFVNNVINEIDDDTLFILMGDHGQRGDGGHSGGDFKETSAALFMYSKSKPINSSIPVDKFNEVKGMGYRKVNQIDFGASLALLLGVPIPHGSLGQVIPELFLSTEPTELSGWKKLMDAQRLVLWQLRNFLYSYSEMSTEFRNSNLFKDYDKHLDLMETGYLSLESPISDSNDFSHVYQQYSSMSRQVYNYCVEKWATFDRFSMLWGLIIMAFILLSLMVVTTQAIINSIYSNGNQHMVFPFANIVWFGMIGLMISPLVWIILIHWNNFKLVAISMCCIGSTIGMIYDIVKSKIRQYVEMTYLALRSHTFITIYMLFSPLLTILSYVYLLDYFWNVNHQWEVLSYFTPLVSMHLIYIYYQTKKPIWDSSNTLDCIILVLPYIYSSTYQSLGLSERIETILPEKIHVSQLLILMVVGFFKYALPLTFIYFTINQCVFKYFNSGNGVGNQNVNIDKSMLKVALGSIGMYWYLKSTESLAKWSNLTVCIFPWTVYTISLVGLYRVYKVFNSIKDENRQRSLLYKLSLVVIYILATNILVERVKAVTDLMWMIVEFIAILRIGNRMFEGISQSKSNQPQANSKDGANLVQQYRWYDISSPLALQFIQWTSLIFQATISAYFHYFTTGRQFEFGYVQFESGYIGFKEYFMPRTTLMVLLNTFSSHILYTFALPIFIIYLRYNNNNNNTETTNINQNNENNYNNNNILTSESRWRTMNDIIIGYLLYLFYFIVFNFSISTNILVYKLDDLHLWLTYAPMYMFNTAIMMIIIVIFFLTFFSITYFKSKLESKII